MKITLEPRFKVDDVVYIVKSTFYEFTNNGVREIYKIIPVRVDSVNIHINRTATKLLYTCEHCFNSFQEKDLFSLKKSAIRLCRHKNSKKAFIDHSQTEHT